MISVNASQISGSGYATKIVRTIIDGTVCWIQDAVKIGKDVFYVCRLTDFMHREIFMNKRDRKKIRRPDAFLVDYFDKKITQGHNKDCPDYLVGKNVTKLKVMLISSSLVDLHHDDLLKVLALSIEAKTVKEIRSSISK